MLDTHLTQSQKQKRYRSRLSQQGLRPVQIWVPDISAPNFIEECHRQAQLIASHVEEEKEIMKFIEAATDWSDE